MHTYKYTYIHVNIHACKYTDITIYVCVCVCIHTQQRLQTARVFWTWVKVGFQKWTKTRPNTLHQETPNTSSSKLPQKAQNSQKRSRDRAAIGTASQEYCSGISWVLKNYAPPWMKTSSLLRSLIRTAVGVLTPRCRDTRRHSPQLPRAGRASC